MQLKLQTSLLAALAVGGLSIATSQAALTTGLAYAAFNVPNPDSSSTWATDMPAGAVPSISTAWGNMPNVAGGLVSDGGGDGVQVGAAAVWNSVGPSSLQDGNAVYVTQLYRGFFYDSDGMFAFAENIDDNVQIKIDGTVVLMNNQATQGGAWQSVTSNLSDAAAAGDVANGNTAWASLTPLQQAGNHGIGWHSVEIRLGEFGGTGGPHASQLNPGIAPNWNPSFGFGIAGIGNSPLPAGDARYDALSYVSFDAANFPNGPDGGPGLRYDSIDPTGGTNIIIPEPGGMTLLFSGLALGLMGRRRRA